MADVFKLPVNYRAAAVHLPPESFTVSGGSALLAEAPIDPAQASIAIYVAGSPRQRVEHDPAPGEYRLVMQTVYGPDGEPHVTPLPLLQFHASDEGLSGLADYYGSGTVLTAQFFAMLMAFLTPITGVANEAALADLYPPTSDPTRRGRIGDIAFTADGSGYFSNGEKWTPFSLSGQMRAGSFSIAHAIALAFDAGYVGPALDGELSIDLSVGIEIDGVYYEPGNLFAQAALAHSIAIEADAIQDEIGDMTLAHALDLLADAAAGESAEGAFAFTMGLAGEAVVNQIGDVPLSHVLALSMDAALDWAADLSLAHGIGTTADAALDWAAALGIAHAVAIDGDGTFGMPPPEVTFDAVASSPASGTGVTTLDLTTMTVGSGARRVLIALLSTNGTISNLTATWDYGVSNQKMGCFGGGSVWMAVLASPVSGNKTLRFTWTTSRNALASAIAFSGAHQGGAFKGGNGYSSGAAASNPSITIASAVGRKLVDVLAHNAGTVTANTQTLLYNIGIGAAQRADGAASVVMGYTIASNAITYALDIFAHPESGERVDGFFYPDGAALSSCWTTVPSEARPKCSGGNKVAAATQGTRSVACWTDDDFADDQYAEFSIGATDPTASLSVGAVVRAQTDADTYYVAGIIAGDSEGFGSVTNWEFHIWKVVAGVMTSLASWDDGGSLIGGCRIRFEVSGTSLVLKTTGSNLRTGWTTRCTATDSAIAHGRPGLAVVKGYVYNSQTESDVQGWYGGNL